MKKVFKEVGLKTVKCDEAFYYKYGKSVGQKVLNYNQVSHEADFSRYHDIEKMI